MNRYLILLGAYAVTVCLPLAVGVARNFEYEYAQLVALAAIVFIPLCAIVVPIAQVRTVATSDRRLSFALETLCIFVISPLVGLIPAAIAFLTKACQCSNTNFLVWWVLLTYPAWIIAHGIFHVISRLRLLRIKRLPGGGDQKTMIALHSTLIVAAVAVVVLCLWLSPQKRITSLLLGHFHGPIYDEYLPMDWGIVVMRGAHLAAGTALLQLAWLRKAVLPIVRASLAILAFGFLVSWARTFPENINGRAALDAALPATVNGNGFILHYERIGAEGAEQTRQSEDVASIVNQATFHITELSSLLTTGWKDGKFAPPLVHIYLYRDRNQKKILFGAGDTDVTDVVMPSIHISHEAWPHSTLRHELVHALTSSIGYYGLGFHPNIALTEGLAVALAPSPQRLNLDDAAAAIIKSNRLKDVTNLFSPFFWMEPGNRAYVVAGSMIRHLVDVHGINAVLRLYSGESWDKAVPVPLEKFAGEWREKILAAYDAERNQMYADSLFRYDGLFHSACVHSKVILAKARDAGSFLRLRQPLGWDPRRDYWRWRLDIDPDDREAQFGRIRDAASEIRVQQQVQDGNAVLGARVLADLVQQKKWPPESIEDVESIILESDLERFLGNAEKSVALLERAREISVERNFGETLHRQMVARLELENTLGDDDSTYDWRMYLAGWNSKFPESRRSEPWIVTYMRLIRPTLFHYDRKSLAVLLGKAIPPGLPETFSVQWYRHIASRALQLGDFTVAADALQRAAAASSAGKEYLSSLEREMRYFQSNPPRAIQR